MGTNMEFHDEHVFVQLAPRIVRRLTYEPALQTGDRIIMQIDRPRCYAITRDQRRLAHFLFSASPAIKCRSAASAIERINNGYFLVI